MCGESGLNHGFRNALKVAINGTDLTALFTKEKQFLWEDNNKLISKLRKFDSIC